MTSCMRMADGLLGPGDGHDADRAVELRDVEVDRRLAVRVETNGAGEEGDELLGRRAALGGQAAPPSPPVRMRPVAPSEPSIRRP